MAYSLDFRQQVFKVIEVQFEVVTATLEQATIPVEGLFLDADTGFDSKDFRNSCE
jgi:hypothetical protein